MFSPKYSKTKIIVKIKNNFLLQNFLFQYLGGCQAFAKLLKGKSPEELRELLGLEVVHSNQNP